MIVTAHQHVVDDSGGIKKLIRQIKHAERRTKRAYATGRPRRLGRSRENFRRLAMLKTTPLNCEKKQSMSEEARPVALGERTVKSGGCPEARRLRRERKSQACLDLVRRPVAQPPVEAS